MQVILRLTAALLFLVACSPTSEAVEDSADDVDEVSETVAEEELAPDVMEQCDASDYRPLIGTPVDEAALSGDPMLRVYGENDIITQEYLPRRTNIVYNSRKVIRNVYCG
ncbi:MAG: hypothetical protein ACR2OY_00645 [Boseongicola sp.]